MSKVDQPKSSPGPAKDKRRGGALGRFLVLIAVVILVPASLWASSATFARLWKPKAVVYETLAIDSGDVEQLVVENGSLESANNTTLRCQVEALIGVVGGSAQQQAGGGAAGGQGQQGGAAAGGTASSAQGQQGGAAGGAAAGGAAGAAGGAAGAEGASLKAKKVARPGSRKPGTITSKSLSTMKPLSRPGTTGEAAKLAQSTSDAISSGMGGTGSSGADSSGSSSSSGSSGGGGGGGGGMSGGGGGGGMGGGGGGGGGGRGGGGGGGGAGASGGAGATTGAQNAVTLNPKPTLRSFTYNVAAYKAVRPITKAVQTQAKAAPPPQPQQRGGRGGGNNNNQEKAGSTRIVWIAPEGSWVKAGDVVCKLDASAFEDALQAQQIRYIQAKSYVDQAESMLRVNQLLLEEYEQGLYPQDVMVIQAYIKSSRVATEQAKQNYDWSLDLFKKKLRSPEQLSSDRWVYDQAVLLEREAKLMADRLVNYTGPKLRTSLKAKIEANRTDLFAQRAAFEIENDRLRRLQKMVDNCTITAPKDGLVVYATKANGWGRVEDQIQEGVTVRQGQEIINLPDPSHMRVRTKVNETKIDYIYTGQKAKIRIDAFPDQILYGTVAEITGIPAPSNGPISDVKVYYAMVNIDTGGFKELRPGLSAEVEFFRDFRTSVTRIPMGAIRWVDRKPFVAIPNVKGFGWQAIELGLIGPQFAEVTDGLKPGDRVIANPSDLSPAPRIVQNKAVAIAN